ncbi:tRNA (adenosine(37)-N6)-dimethylallyltransferase MiaA [Leptothrix discophora]|uniref:tRNA dimethylallyltransferase n=1 Tax=Leptothrix discophora TaxID=89 RepID=A0ABT9G2D3_LEPDI|nr:tRNA (adenosine(37)-N6)-dimethylallyltransferase MiaA [Leptothrix discophora]MDP4300644.1 tRNA (adenosine(37)-N6)-dimethylallyltransferase MiaA [Leptothrix discophora]
MTSTTTNTRPPWLALAGPTASGKTAAALAIVRAQRARGGPPVEVISVDSALVYRGMDIGTAKPSAAERAEVPHHLIDLIEPTGAYSAAEFAQAARRLVDEIHARGARALLVGGTMLYFKAWLEGIDPLPAADPAVRAALDARAQAIGWPAMHAELARVDPVTAARLAPADAQRIQRALEVHALTGQPLSALHQRDRQDGSPSPAGPGSLVALEPASRAWLHQRIAERFGQMLDAGLVDEVRRLRERGDLDPGLPSMRCVGYRQTWEMLERAFPATELAERGIAATRQLAKRQLTWLRGMPARRVIACDAPDALAQVLSLAEQAGFLVPER